MVRNSHCGGVSLWIVAFVAALGIMCFEWRCYAALSAISLACNISLSFIVLISLVGSVRTAIVFTSAVNKPKITACY